MGSRQSYLFGSESNRTPAGDLPCGSVAEMCAPGCRGAQGATPARLGDRLFGRDRSLVNQVPSAPAALETFSHSVPRRTVGALLFAFALSCLAWRRDVRQHTHMTTVYRCLSRGVRCHIFVKHGRVSDVGSLSSKQRLARVTHAIRWSRGIGGIDSGSGTYLSLDHAG